eukprot:s2477_g16.t1
MNLLQLACYQVPSSKTENIKHTESYRAHPVLEHVSNVSNPASVRLLMEMAVCTATLYDMLQKVLPCFAQMLHKDHEMEECLWLWDRALLCVSYTSEHIRRKVKSQCWVPGDTVSAFGWC